MSLLRRFRNTAVRASGVEFPQQQSLSAVQEGELSNYTIKIQVAAEINFDLVSHQKTGCRFASCKMAVSLKIQMGLPLSRAFSHELFLNIVETDIMQRFLTSP